MASKKKEVVEDKEPKRPMRERVPDPSAKKMVVPQMVMRVRITFIDEMLGTMPTDPEIYKKWIATKAENPEVAMQQIAELFPKKKLPEPKEAKTAGDKDGEAKEDEEENTKGTTALYRDPDGRPFLYGYMFKGQFKAACSALKAIKRTDSHKGYASASLTAFKKKIDLHVHVQEITPHLDGDVVLTPIAMEPSQRASRKIYLNFPDGKVVTGSCQRPLRVDGQKGERVCLADSETAPAGTTAEFEVLLLDASLGEMVEEWLACGMFDCGMGQWRSAGKGAFTYEILSIID